MTLEGIQRELAGRAMVRAVGDPVLPFVSKLARVIMAQMTADVDGTAEDVEEARVAYDALLDEARAAADEWRSEGREDYARRLGILFRTTL